MPKKKSKESVWDIARELAESDDKFLKKLSKRILKASEHLSRCDLCPSLAHSLSEIDRRMGEHNRDALDRMAERYADFGKTSLPEWPHVPDSFKQKEKHHES